MLTEPAGGLTNDTTRYPEGCILKVINHRNVQGVEMCDIKVDYYKYSGLEDGTYFGWVPIILVVIVGANVARCQGFFGNCIYLRDL